MSSDGGYCLMRLGAPHEGHASLVARMLAVCASEPALVLVGSSDKTGRADVPLPWEERRDLLDRLLAARGVPGAAALVYAPLPEIVCDGHDRAWFEHVLGACRGALGHEPGRYFFGGDYSIATFDVYRQMRPTVELHRVERLHDKSGSELRRAIVTGDAALRAKYALELSVYPPAALARIAQLIA